MNILKPKPNPQQQLRDWQRKLRQECLNIELQIRDIEREEKIVQKAIREAAKRNDMVSAKALAKELVRSKKTVNRSTNDFNIDATWRKCCCCLHCGSFIQEFRGYEACEQSHEGSRGRVIEEILNDAVDIALDSEDIEEVDKVLTAIAGETSAQLPEAVRKDKMKQPAVASQASCEEELIAEGVDDEDDLEEIRARLAKVRS